MKTYLYTNVQSSISHNRQKLEIIQISISWWVDKDHVVYPCGCCSVTQSCPALCNTVDCSTPDFFVLDCLLEFSLTHVHWVNNAIQPSHSPSPPSPPALNLSQHQGLFRWVNSFHQVAKVLSFSFSISPSSECSGLISFRMDCLDLLAVQGTLKSLLQDHSWKASVLQCSTFFIVQLSHPYVTTGFHPWGDPS